jgi:hypothetical protein
VALMVNARLRSAIDQRNRCAARSYQLRGLVAWVVCAEMRVVGRVCPQSVSRAWLLLESVA